MIISHTHKYVFIELPSTGTTAVSAELCRKYDGENILKKHSTYPTFLAQASPHEKEYFSFSCVRNPMDAVVSQYFKLKTDHWNFEHPRKLAKRNALNKFVFSNRRLKQLRYIRDNDADFASYFLRFYTRPYSTWAVLSHHQLDFVMRFERLSDDFARAITKIGLQPVRPLPMRNKTSDRESDFLEYYSVNTIERAKTVFGPFMSEWDYDFPESWGDVKTTAWQRYYYSTLNAVRKIFWKYLKHAR